MALLSIEISKLNSLKLFELNQSFDPRYNTSPIDFDSFYSQISGFSVKQQFAQKIQFNDRISFQVNCNQNFGSKIQLIDQYGTQLFTWNESYYATVLTIPGNTVVVNNTSILQNTIHYILSLSQVQNLKQGNYWFLYTINVDTDNDGVFDNTITYLSEPIKAASKHKNTMLVEYSNSVNRFDTIFTQTGAIFSLRLESVIGKREPIAHDTSFVDQTERLKQLSSYPSEKFIYTIGGREGVPEYLLDTINRVFSCSNILIDGVQYVKDESSKWEITRSSLYPLVWAGIEIRKAIVSNSNLTIKKYPILLWESNNSYPYAVHTVNISDGFQEKTVASQRVVEDATDEANYINSLNAQLSSLGLIGYLNTVVSGVNKKFYYQPGINEYYNACTVNQINRLFFFVTRLATGNMAINMTAFASRICVSWYNGGCKNYGTNLYDTLILKGIYNNSTPSGNTIRIFHNNNIQVFNSTTSNKINGIGGTMSNILTEFYLGLAAITGFNASLLYPCSSTLAALSVYGTNATSVTGLGASTWPMLFGVWFSGNKLTSSALDLIYNNLNANAAYLNNGGSIDTSSQNPNATVTSASLSARQNLINNKGWTINA